MVFRMSCKLWKLTSWLDLFSHQRSVCVPRISDWLEMFHCYTIFLWEDLTSTKSLAPFFPLSLQHLYFFLPCGIYESSQISTFNYRFLITSSSVPAYSSFLSPQRAVIFFHSKIEGGQFWIEKIQLVHFEKFSKNPLESRELNPIKGVSYKKETHY